MAADGDRTVFDWPERPGHSVVLTAGGLAGWVAVAGGILLRRPSHGGIYRAKFTELQVTLDQEQPWELDGEVMGSTRQLAVVAQPGGLLLRMPQESVNGTHD